MVSYRLYKMDSEIVFERRMKRRDKLIAKTARDYIEVYDRDGKIGELLDTHILRGVDISYIEEFLDELKEEIIQQLQ